MSVQRGHLGGCYLNNNNGDLGSWAPPLWDRLIDFTNAKSIVDVGCGGGYSLKYFIDKGLDGLGIDGLEEVLQHSPVSERIVIHDYTKGEYVLNCDVDLAWSCEFVEHVEEKYKENFMKTFDRCKYIGITHATPGQDGYHHVNCQHADYWINSFSDHGFDYLEQESKEMRNLLLNKPYGNWPRLTFMLFKKRA